MSIITISIFLFICFGLGYALLVLRRPKTVVDTLLLSFALGLGAIPLVMLILRIIHIPLDVHILLVLAGIGPAIGIWRWLPKESTTVTRYAGLAAAFIFTIVITAIMYQGATAYPYLENDDPWGYAVAAKFVALEKTTAQSVDRSHSHYLEPYPPYYAALMGVLHQTHGDLKWILKFFNALIIGMSILCAFYAFEALTGDSMKAVVGAAILGFIPAYMSHFIWSQTLAIPVFFMALWSLAQLRDIPLSKDILRDGRMWQAVLLIWSATIIQPSTAVIFVILTLTYAGVLATANLADRKRLPHTTFLAIVGGGVLSFSTWAWLASTYGFNRLMSQIGVRASIFAGSNSVDTSGGIVYSLKDIIIPPLSSKIDQATGLGLLTSILVLLALIIIAVNWRKVLKPKNSWNLAIAAWLIIGIIGIQGNALPVRLFPHRFWVFLAIPVALLAAETIVVVSKSILRKKSAYALIAIVALLVIWSLLAPRLAVQQAIWPPGVLWTSQEEIAAYVELSERLPLQSPVFALCTDESRLIGMNMYSKPWDPNLIAFKARAGNLTGVEIADFMSRSGYEYLVVDSNCVTKIGLNETQAMLESMAEAQRFRPIIQRPGIGVVQVVA